MRIQNLIRFSLMLSLVMGPFLVSCSSVAAPISATAVPDWYNFQMTDVRTGKTFTIHDFAGKVVLIQAIAEWCPNCLFQQGETRKMTEQLGHPEDLILISMDVDLHEDASSLRKYTEDFGFEWRFAIAPLEVQRAMANLYSPEYHNPPLDPILLIDRQGNAHQLPYNLKEADTLQKIVKPYLEK